MRRALAACALALLLASCGGGGGGGDTGSGNGPTGQATVTTSTITSSFTGQTYPLTIYTPPGYAASTDAKAILYAPDDELQFATLRQMVEVLHLDVIIVSVGNLGSARRFIDFDLPAAVPFYRFLTREVIPLVEPQLRVDTTRRTLLGYSLSGLFAVIALFEENPASRYFSGYVITDPSLQFHTAELFAYEQQLWNTTHSLPVSAYHCSTVGGHPYTTFPQQIIDRGYTGLRYKFMVYTFSHGAVLGPCINDGLRYVFALP